MSRWLLLLLLGCGGSAARDAMATEPAIDAAPDALPARCTPQSGTAVTARRIAVVEQPAMLVTSPPYDRRLFVVQQAGRIQIIDDEVLRAQPFLEITRATTGLDSGGEQGLLGLAFHPKFAQNGTFFIYYTVTEVTPSVAHFDVLARYRVSADPNVADAASGEILLKIPANGRNHNGGMIEFGRDGLLYIGTGDTSGTGFGNSQNRSSLLGKILRIDVDGMSSNKPYGIPTANPYADGIAGAPEIFLLGLRNPWRWSFDRLSYDMYIADVGQDVVEELTIVPFQSAAGANLGWYPLEGRSCVPGQTCDATGTVLPQVEKDHNVDGWCAIIGGQVYRGPCMPDLAGTYFFSDYCAGGLWSLRAEGGTITSPPAQVAGTFPASISSIHADERGELFMTTTNGEVLQLEPPR